MAPRPTSKPDTDTTDTAEPATDSAPAADVQPAEPQRVVVEQAPAEPAVFYGPEGVQPEPREHVKAVYEPFEW